MEYDITVVTKIRRACSPTGLEYLSQGPVVYEDDERTDALKSTRRVVEISARRMTVTHKATKASRTAIGAARTKIAERSTVKTGIESMRAIESRYEETRKAGK